MFLQLQNLFDQTLRRNDSFTNLLFFDHDFTEQSFEMGILEFYRVSDYFIQAI